MQGWHDFALASIVSSHRSSSCPVAVLLRSLSNDEAVFPKLLDTYITHLSFCAFLRWRCLSTPGFVLLATVPACVVLPVVCGVASLARATMLVTFVSLPFETGGLK